MGETKTEIGGSDGKGSPTLLSRWWSGARSEGKLCGPEVRVYDSSVLEQAQHNTRAASYLLVELVDLSYSSSDESVHPPEDAVGYKSGRHTISDSTTMSAHRGHTGQGGASVIIKGSESVSFEHMRVRVCIEVKRFSTHQTSF